MATDTESCRSSFFYIFMMKHEADHSEHFQSGWAAVLPGLVELLGRVGTSQGKRAFVNIHFVHCLFLDWDTLLAVSHMLLDWIGLLQCALYVAACEDLPGAHFSELPCFTALLASHCFLRYNLIVISIKSLCCTTVQGQFICRINFP